MNSWVWGKFSQQLMSATMADISCALIYFAVSAGAAGFVAGAGLLVGILRLGIALRLGIRLLTPALCVGMG